MTSSPSADLGPFSALAESLQEITEALAATGTQREVLEIVLTPAVRALGAVAGIVLLVDQTDQQLKIAGSQGYEDVTLTIWQEGPLEDHQLISDILRMGEGRYFEEAGALKEAYPDLERRTGGLAAIANAALPMFLDGRPLGIIVLDFTEPHAFTPAERRFLTILAAQCAVALGRAEAIRALEARVEERTRQLEEERAALEIFVAFAEAVGSETDVQALVRQATTLLVDTCGVDVIYVEQEGGLFKPSAWSPEFDPALLQLLQPGFPLQHSGIAQVLLQNTAAFIDHWNGTRLLIEASGIYQALGGYPYFVGGQLQSVLIIGSLTSATWAERERKIFRAVGRSLDLALERAEQARELTAQRDMLQASNEELEAFTYSISHDLRTPVRHISSFMGLLRRALPEPLSEKAARYFTVIEDAAQHLSQLIDGMLALSRTSRQPFQPEPVDLGRLVEAARGELTLAHPHRRISWQVAPLPVVMGDVVMLRQVIVALLDNAVKYTRTRQEASIEIWAEERGQTWAVFVRDNGVGFDQRYRDKLFTMFQRLHHQSDFEGAGMSLANTRRIVARHGGLMTAEGQVDQGASFGFILPKAKP